MAYSDCVPIILSIDTNYTFIERSIQNTSKLGLLSFIEMYLYDWLYSTRFLMNCSLSFIAPIPFLIKQHTSRE